MANVFYNEWDVESDHIDTTEPRKESRSGRWSTRRTVAFTVLVCGAFWVAAGYAIVHFFF